MARNGRNSKQQMIKAAQAQVEAILAECRAEAEDMILEYVSVSDEDDGTIPDILREVTNQLAKDWSDVPGVIKDRRTSRRDHGHSIYTEVKEAFNSLASEGYIYTDADEDVCLTEAGRKELVLILNGQGSAWKKVT